MTQDTFLPLEVFLHPNPDTGGWQCEVMIADHVQIFSEKTYNGPDGTALFYLALTHWLAVNARVRASYGQEPPQTNAP